MRVLIPNFRAPDSFVDNVACTFEQMGHAVATMPSRPRRDRSPYWRLLHDAASARFPQRWSPYEAWAVGEARRQRYDVVLGLTLTLRSEVLSELASSGVTNRVAWWGDPPANMRGLGLAVDGWTQVYAKDPAAVEKLQTLGSPAKLLHEAANPEWHRPIKVADHYAAGRLAVAGNCYGYRCALVTRLITEGCPVAIYGPKPPKWAPRAIRKAHTGIYIAKEQKSKAFHNATACLNSTSFAEGQSLNCRAFEIAACGGLQLIEPKDHLQTCFEPGKEVLTYSSIDEIIEYANRAIREPEWAGAIREAGLRRLLAEHTYRHRIESMLSDLKAS